MTPAPTYRTVNEDTGKQLKPYQTKEHAAVFVAALAGMVTSSVYVDSATLNLHTIYLRAI